MKPFHRNPHTVGASEKQRKIWGHLRKFHAMSGHDSYLGSWEIDSDSVYQSLLNLVFECADDNTNDAALLQALDTLQPFKDMRKYVYGDPVNAGLSFIGLMPTVYRILQGAGDSADGPIGPDGKDQNGTSAAELIKKYVEETKEELERALQGTRDENSGFSIDGDPTQDTGVMNLLFGNGASELRMIMKTVGSMEVDANAAIREKRKNVMGEYADVTQGQDLNRLIQSEYMALATPELEDQFWMRWAQDEATISEVKGNEYEGRGPLVIVVDESGSMQTVFDGLSCHQWARSITLTLAKIALKANRPVHVVKFSNNTHDNRLRRGAGGAFNKEDFKWLASTPMNGGTNIARALDVGFTNVNKLNTDHSRADIVLITDFNFTHMGQISTMRRNNPDTRVFGILVADPTYVGDVTQEVCDELHVVSTLANAKTLMSAAKFISPK